MTSIAERVIDKMILNWKTVLTFSLLAFAAVSIESCAGRVHDAQTVVAKDVPCVVTTINDDATVSVNCGGSLNSFVDSEMAIGLLKKPQPLICTLHRDKDSADCSLPKPKKG